MTWWQTLLAVLAFIALCVALAIWATAAAYRREAEEYGEVRHASFSIGIAPKVGRFRRAWFYWLPRVRYQRPAVFSNWTLTIFWLCFHIHAEGGGKGLA